MTQYWTFGDLKNIFPADEPSNNESSIIQNESQKSIVLTPDIRIIDGAFDGNENLEEVVIPEGVEEIGSKAFRNCYNLKKVVLPKSLRTIDVEAFRGCINLCDITLNKGLESIRAGAFAHCKSLESIIIPEGIKNIFYRSFAGCSLLENIKLPNSLQKIELYAFGDCLSLKSIIIPEGVKNIGNNSFHNCHYLKIIGIPSTLEITDYSFLMSCKYLKTIIIPKEIESILKHFLDNSSIGSRKLTIYTTNNYQKIVDQINENDEATIENLLTNNKLEKLDFDDSEITFSEGIKHLDKINIPNKKAIKKINLPNSLKTISSHAFENFENLEEITIPDGVTVIEEGTFANCYNLKKVVLPKNLKRIEILAFYDCVSLEEMELPDYLESIGDYAFSGCEKLVIKKLPTDLKKLGSFPPSGINNIKTITIPEGVTILGPTIFADYSNLKIVNLPKSLRKIDVETFKNCKALEKISLPKGLKTICDSAFSGCESLKELKIPNTVKKIEDYAIDNCNSLTELFFPEGVEEIGVISSCSNLETIYFPSTLTYAEIVPNCPSLKKVYLPANARPSNLSSFNSCQLIPYNCDLVIPYKSYYELIEFVYDNKEFLKEFIKKNSENSKWRIQFSGPMLSVSNKLTIAITLQSLQGYIFNNNYIINSAMTDNNEELSEEIQEIIQQIQQKTKYLPYNIRIKIERKMYKLLKHYNKKVEEYKPKYFDPTKKEIVLDLDSLEYIKPNLVASLTSLLANVESISYYNEQIKTFREYKKLLVDNSKSVDGNDNITTIIIEILSSIRYLEKAKRTEIENNIANSIDEVISQIEEDVESLFDDDPFTMPSEEEYKKLLYNKLSLLVNQEKVSSIDITPPKPSASYLFYIPTEKDLSSFSNKKDRDQLELLKTALNDNSLLKKYDDKITCLLAFTRFQTAISLNIKDQEKYCSLVNKYNEIIEVKLHDIESSTNESSTEIENSLRKELNEILEEMLDKDYDAIDEDKYNQAREQIYKELECCYNYLNNSSLLEIRDTGTGIIQRIIKLEKKINNNATLFDVLVKLIKNSMIVFKEPFSSLEEYYIKRKELIEIFNNIESLYELFYTEKLDYVKEDPRGIKF